MIFSKWIDDMSAVLSREKREYPRVASNRLVLVKDDSGKINRVVAINYSQTGMALHSHISLPLGEFIDLNFKLNDNDSEILTMTAEVMQNFKEGNAYITGVKFVGKLDLN